MTIKKILTALLIMGCFQGIVAQVLVSSQNLELKKSSNYNEIFAAKEAKDQELVVFAADKKTLTALHYNSALFYKDSLVTQRPDAPYALMAGYSYNDNGTQVYWASEDYTKIKTLNFNFNTRAITSSTMEIALQDDFILSTFSENNSFYILSLPEKGDKLNLYILNNGVVKQKVLDFSGFSFFDANNKKTRFNTLMQEYPLQKIEATAFNALPTAGSKIKLYVLDSSILLTLDHNPALTQLFTLDLQANTLTEKIFPQLLLKHPGKGNSFYFKQKLYQIKLNEEEIALATEDITTGDVLRSYIADSEDTITFKNSPLLVQAANKRASELKNTKKFLSKAAMGSAALSVYQTPNDLMLVAGGVRNAMPAGDAILSAAITGVIIGGGGSGDAIGLFDPENVQTVYFEGLFDENFSHKPYTQGRLAVDQIGQFIGNNPVVSLQSVINFNGYSLLGFYNAKTREYVLMKFEDEHAY